MTDVSERKRLKKGNVGDLLHRLLLHPHPIAGVEVNRPRNRRIRIEVWEIRWKSLDRRLALKNFVDSFFFSSDVKTKKKHRRSSSSSSSSSFMSSSSSSSSSSDKKTKRKKSKRKKSKTKKKKTKLKKQNKKEKKKKQNELRKKSKAAVVAVLPSPPAIKPPPYPELWQSDEVEFGPGGLIGQRGLTVYLDLSVSS